ncbi:WD repeat-containing protein DWA1 [Acorus gramineus]|uniref:WD repeat-containing protein DWA1 n=1 Tax=Acorus gramineus TaxID=55184 RepID=A0AAV9AL44_ACOGR|nr:WD repeat-containing protein DWA1 [Acorus gramineus]
MGDARDWDEDGYRRSILSERELQCRTVFRTAFAPNNPRNDHDVLVVASSDGSVAPYDLSSSSALHLNQIRGQQSLLDIPVAEPMCCLNAHKGPAYDVKFYGDGDDSLLLSCGDDGRICGWRWNDISNSDESMPMQGVHLESVLELVNPQHQGPWDALSPIPETNAIAVNKQEGSIFSATGDGCAYCWDVETSKRTMTFRGHSAYLHCVVARKSSNQIITGSEDGTARIWDCRSGQCVKVIHPQKGCKLTDSYSYVSCVAVDKYERWLVCGSGRNVSVWSLPACELILSFENKSSVQDVLINDNQILVVGAEPVLTRMHINGEDFSKIQCAPPSAFSVSLHPSGVTAVGGYGGLVDIVSEFGSHLCTFRCSCS